jgi:outer membrane protein assembly factor BamB
MQWRGAERDGSVPADAKKGDWLPQAVMLWQREVGDGYSGPIVKGDHVWVQTRKKGEEVVSCLTLSAGETVWSKSYDAPFKQDPTATVHGLGPYSTPTLADGRLFTFSITSVLSAWDADNGILLWRREYSQEFEPSYPIFGMSASPLVWDNQCFVHFGHSGWDEFDGQGAMVALRVSDGQETWRWDGDGPALAASPVIAVIEGVRQLVFKSQENIVGLAPQTGKELWRIPYKVSMDNTIVTPLVIGNRLLTSDYDKRFHAWQIQSNGESWTVRKLWRNRAVSLFMSSPVLVGKQLIGFSHLRSGQLFGLDPSDGEVLWRGEPRSGEHASLISWGNEVLVFQEDGSLVVGKVSREGMLSQRRYRLGSSPMWGHPAIVNGQIIIKNGSHLKVYRLRV